METVINVRILPLHYEADGKVFTLKKNNVIIEQIWNCYNNSIRATLFFPIIMVTCVDCKFSSPFFQSMPGLASFCVATAIALASIYFLVVSKLELFI